MSNPLAHVGPDAIMMLVGTKKDIATADPNTRQVSRSEAKTLATTKHMLDCIETSAKENTNIEVTFLKMAKALWRKYEGMNSLAEHEASIRLTTHSLEEQKSHWCSCSVL